jgi:hypothetical protein
VNKSGSFGAPAVTRTALYSKYLALSSSLEIKLRWSNFKWDERKEGREIVEEKNDLQSKQAERRFSL